jgi:hypothetical protein
VVDDINLVDVDSKGYQGLWQNLLRGYLQRLLINILLSLYHRKSTNLYITKMLNEILHSSGHYDVWTTTVVIGITVRPWVTRVAL